MRYCLVATPLYWRTFKNQGVTGVFSRAAPVYDRVGPRFFSHFGRRLAELAQIPSGARVLDVATGKGAVLFPAAEAVAPHGHVARIDLADVFQRLGSVKQADGIHELFPALFALALKPGA